MNHEAWVIPYADLLTLLMAMFIALFAISTVNTSKFKDLALGFNQALGGGKLDSSVFGGRTRSDVADPGQRVRQRARLGRQSRREQQHRSPRRSSRSCFDATDSCQTRRRAGRPTR